MTVNRGRSLGLAKTALLSLVAVGCGGGCGGESDSAAGGSVGSAELSWMPPTENTDGSVLADLAGYEIRYGRSSTELSATIDLTNPSLNRYLVENLSAGTWYFAVTSVNSQGARSAPSNVASKTIS
jgi:Fibronectin type III domain